MFTVYCDGTCIYDPRDADLALLEPKVTLELNKAGSFTFKLPPEHTYYDLPQKIKSKIIVYWDDDAIFYGRPVTESIDFWNQKSIECEGELAYLNDTIQRPGEYHYYTVRQYLEMLIGNHNNQVDEDRQFTVGIVTVTADDSDDDDEGSLYRYTNYNSTMEEAKADLVDDLGGYLKVRNEDGYRYLDYLNLDDYGDTSDQVIEFGENLLDFARNIDMSDVATAIIPLGETLDESEIEALDAHLTIEDVNDGVDYIQDDDAVEKYGFIVKVVEWSDITTAEYLLSKATKYLSNYTYESLFIEASAVDMHLADDEVMRLKLGDKVRVLSEPHDLDEYFYISAMSIRLDSPSSTTVTLGVDESESLSAQTASISAEVQNTKVSKSTILASATAQATALITEATHGFIVLNDSDEDGVVDELLIMDTSDISTATRVWRWNLNGLGYSSSGYDGEYGTAITMDGQIVGTYIAAGTVGTEQLSVEYLASVEEEISNALLTAQEYTDDELTNYYTITQIQQELQVGGGVLDSIIAETYATISSLDELESSIYSQITQTYDSILLTVSQTYATLETVTALSGDLAAEVTRATEAEGTLESSITLTKEEILLTVSETYVSATTYTAGLSDTLASAQEYADSAANSAESAAEAYTDSALVSYSTTTEVESLISQSSDSILLSVSATYVTSETYLTGLSDTLSSAESYTDTALTSYSTTTEVESLISQSTDSVLLSVSQTYATTETVTALSDDLAEEVTRATTAESELSASITVNADAISAEVTRATEAEGTLSTLITTTAEGIEAEIEDTQNSARTYFAADSTSITISTGTIAFASDSISISSDYFTLTADGKITATSVTLSGTFTTDDGTYWATIGDGALTCGLSGSTTVYGYASVAQTSGYMSIGGSVGLILAAPYIYVGAYGSAGGATASHAGQTVTSSNRYFIYSNTTGNGPTAKTQTIGTALSKSTLSSVVTSLSTTTLSNVLTSSYYTGTVYLPTGVSYSSTIGGYYISSYSSYSGIPYSVTRNTLTYYSSYSTSSTALSSSTSLTTTTLYYLYGTGTYGHATAAFTKGLITSFTTY